jgi:hypothetical protein
MDLSSFSNGAPSYICSACEQPFAGPGPLNFHRHSCRATKRSLQGVLAKAKALWEVKKQSTRLQRPLDNLQPEKAVNNNADPLAQAQDDLLSTAATPTTPSGRDATLGCMAEAGLSVPIDMDSMGTAAAVCGQAITVDHWADSDRLWPLCMWTVYLVTPRAFLWQNKEQGIRTDSFHFNTGMSFQKLLHRFHPPTPRYLPLILMVRFTEVKL